MLDKLDRFVDDVAGLNSKLIVLVGPPGSGKTLLLSRLGERRGGAVINVGSALGRCLAQAPVARRPSEAANRLRVLVAEFDADGLVLLDNIELLFDRSLRLEPLDLLRRQAHARRMVAVWPGEFRDERLTYAAMGHPERRDYAVEGVVPFLLTESEANF